jgi:aromatic-L-amino-acid/L-tryptophan decarboxylase
MEIGMDENLTPPEENLDPQDWEAMRGLAHRMVGDMLDYLKNVRQRPVWQPVPMMSGPTSAAPFP